MLDDAAVTGLACMTEVIDVLDAAVCDLAAAKAGILKGQQIDSGAVKLSPIGAMWPAARLAAVKSHLTVNGPLSFTITGWDTVANQVLFTMSGALTRLRTPPLASLVTRQTLEQAGKMAVFGVGSQGRAYIAALQAQHRFDSICVIDTVDVSDWCAAASQRFRYKVQQTTAQNAVTGADLVVTISRSKTPVFDGSALKPGATGPQWAPACPQAASWRVVEWLLQSMEEAGEVVIGLANGALQSLQMVDPPQLYREVTPLREHPGDIVIFKTVGIGRSDAAGARMIWQRWLAHTPARTGSHGNGCAKKRTPGIQKDQTTVPVAHVLSIS